MKIRNIAANVLTLLIVGGLLALAAVGMARHDFAAPGPSTETVQVEIARGASLNKISTTLGDAGVLPGRAVMGAISGPTFFRLAARYTGKARDLKFGEYAIPPGASVEEIIRLLVEGGNVQHRITIPEGMTTAMAVELLMTEDKLTGDIPELPPEGALFPDTWEFQRGDSRASVLARMRSKMDEVLDAAWAARDPDTPLKSKDELLILASIIEKETRPAEHGRVASVFINRLRRGMRLQTDPTVIYGITLGRAPLGRGLRRSELDAATPYNTYVIDGLPPTPICNPGAESIRAAANPDRTAYLYFVADGTGGHAFAETLAEHNRNVAAWRKIEQERSQNQ